MGEFFCRRESVAQHEAAFLITGARALRDHSRALSCRASESLEGILAFGRVPRISLSSARQATTRRLESHTSMVVLNMSFSRLRKVRLAAANVTNMRLIDDAANRCKRRIVLSPSCSIFLRRTGSRTQLEQSRRWAMAPSLTSDPFTIKPIAVQVNRAATRSAGLLAMTGRAAA
jgi:hypothetical protein